MTARPIAVLLVTLDPAFAATARRLVDGQPGFALTAEALDGGVRRLRDEPPDLTLVDADSVPDPAAAVSVLSLVGRGPVVAAGASLQASPAERAALVAAGAVGVLLKAGGPSGLGLLRDREGALDVLRAFAAGGMAQA